MFCKNDNRNSPPPIAKLQKYSNQTQNNIKTNNTNHAPDKEGCESVMLDVHNESSEKVLNETPKKWINLQSHQTRKSFV